MCVLLLALINLLGITALRSATLDTQLAQSFDAGQRAAALADGAVQRGIRVAREEPALLPAPAPGAEHRLPELVDPAAGLMETRIRFMGKEDYCPEIVPAPAVRLHFEIIGTGQTAGARHALIQGIAICRETCASNSCTGVEYPAVRTYRSSAIP